MKTIFSKQEIQDIVDLYTNKTPIDSIINLYDTNEHYIRQILKDNQVDRTYNNWSDELYDRGIQLYQSGKTLKEISYLLIVSRNGFSNALNKKGIQKRTYSQNNRRYNRNSYYFDNIDNQTKAYFLGLLWADGCNIPSHKQIVLSLQEDDAYLVEKLKTELEYEGRVIPITRVQDKNSKHKIPYRLCIEDIHMSELLESYGMVQNKSLILKFPTCIPDNLLNHFVRGYFDGDGCVYYDTKREKGRVQIVGTFEFCTGLSSILTSLNINHNIRQPKQSIGKNTYILTTSATYSSYHLLSWIYQNAEIKMERKYQTFLQIQKKYNQIYNNKDLYELTTHKVI